MNIAPTLPISSRPVLSWQGFDSIGQKAKIEGDPDAGFEVRFFNEETERWQSPQDLDQYRWIVDAFLGEMMAKAATAGS